jgi:hypothetical protein
MNYESVRFQRNRMENGQDFITIDGEKGTIEILLYSLNSMKKMMALP